MEGVNDGESIIDLIVFDESDKFASDRVLIGRCNRQNCKQQSQFQFHIIGGRKGECVYLDQRA